MFSPATKQFYCLSCYSIRLKRSSRLKLKLKSEHPGVLLVSIFYAVVGVVLASVLTLFSLRLFHVGVLAILNLILAYGLFKMRKWSVKLLTALFFPQVTFGCITLYYSVIMWTFYSGLETAVFNASLVIYILFCFVSLVYVLAKRKDFE